MKSLSSFRRFHANDFLFVSMFVYVLHVEFVMMQRLSSPLSHLLHLSVIRLQFSEFTLVVLGFHRFHLEPKQYLHVACVLTFPIFVPGLISRKASAFILIDCDLFTRCVLFHLEAVQTTGHKTIHFRSPIFTNFCQATVCPAHSPQSSWNRQHWNRGTIWGWDS